MKKWIIVALVFSALAVALAAMHGKVQRQKDTIDRLEQNQTALLDSVQTYRTINDRNAASVRVLELTKAELERDCKNLTGKVQELGIKLKRAEEVAQTATETLLEFQTQVRDSIVYIIDSTATQGYLDSLKVIHWRDPWTVFEGEIRGDVLTARLESCDTITTVLHRVPRNCWLFRWKKDEYRVDVVSSNPHTRVVHEQYVKVTK